jgi:Uma2 family endonuclease
MSSVPRRRLTPQEYLAIERKAEYKNEYFDGEMFAMAGAKRWHNLITGNVVKRLGLQLDDRQCEVSASDMRVKVSSTGLYTYPDVVVVCGEARFEDEEQDTLINPTVLIEVLSKSTEGHDRGKKFEHYRSLASLAEFVLIDQQKPHIEHFVRQPDNQWLLSETNDLKAVIRLPSIECELSLAETYRKVAFGG